MKKDTTGVGALTEGMIMAALLRRGKQVFIPFNASARCDLVLDENGKLLRVQCKTGRIRNGCIKFRNYSMTRAGLRPYTRTEVDAFGVYCPDNGRTYLVPIEVCGTQLTKLRIEPTKNGHNKRVRFAEQFEI